MTTAHAPTVESTDVKRRGRGRALLAGGLVLGLGAALTLAAWTDEVHVFGSFGTGDRQAQFQGNVDPVVGEANWEDYHGVTSDDRGEFTFTMDAEELAPGDVAYAPVALRTTQDSVGFDVTLTTGWDLANLAEELTADEAILFNGLRFQVSEMDEAGDCNATDFASGTPISFPGAGSPGTWVPLAFDSAPGAIDLAAAPDADSTGAPMHLCFAVTLNPNDGGQGLNYYSQFQGKSLEVPWVFAGTAVEAG